jgi:hypothetical protein
LKLRAVPIDFESKNGVIVYNDAAIGEATRQFCLDELVDRPDISQYERSWLVVEEEAGRLVRPLAIGGYRVVFDIPLLRSIDKRATVVLANRISAHLSDKGFRGKDIMLHISDSETPEQRCPEYENTLKVFGARPAERYVVKIF